MRKHTKDTYEQVVAIWKQIDSNANSYDDIKTIMSALNKRFNNLFRTSKSKIKSATMREVLILAVRFSESDAGRKPRTFYYKLAIHFVLHHNFCTNPKFPCVKPNCHHRKDKEKVEDENVYFTARLQRLNRHWRKAEGLFKKKGIVGKFSDFIKKY